MDKTSMKYLINSTKSARNVIIFGAGKSGIYVYKILRKHQIPMAAFCDNSKSLQGKNIGGITIVSVDDAVRLIFAGGGVFVVANIHNALSMKQELMHKGISEDCIILYDEQMICEYYGGVQPEEYEREIQERYYWQFNRTLDLKTPKTFNEKIIWDMLYNADSIKTTLSDKYKVRSWVKDKIGEKYLNQLYGCWERAEQIDFSKLPDQFILKLNHGSGWNIPVKDRSLMNRQEIIEKLEYWRNINYAYDAFELYYKDIKPMIICEKYLENEEEDLFDYKIYCFHGQPEYISFISGRKNQSAYCAFYNTKWEKQPFKYRTHLKIEEDIPKPLQLDKMLELSRILSSQFSYMRVDWYLLSTGEILFGEMTCSPFGGFIPWDPMEYDEILGKLV